MVQKELTWNQALKNSPANLHGLFIVMPKEIIRLIGLDSFSPIYTKIEHCRRYPNPSAAQYDSPNQG